MQDKHKVHKDLDIANDASDLCRQPVQGKKCASTDYQLRFFNDW